MLVYGHYTNMSVIYVGISVYYGIIKGNNSCTYVHYAIRLNFSCLTH